MKNKIKSSSKFVFIIVILVLMLCLALPLAFQISDTEKLYTQQDLEDKYNEGYNDAIKNDELLNSLKSQVDTLTQDNDTKQKQIESLESDKSSLQQQVDNLTQINADNEKTIKDNESTISSLEVQIKNLERMVTQNQKRASRQFLTISNPLRQTHRKSQQRKRKRQMIH